MVFQNPWHSQLFAITVQLSETGNFSWKEFVQFFGKSLKKSRLELNSLDGNDDYFYCWLTALEEIIISKKLGISSIDGSGYRALANISDNGGQEVPHLHFHLFGGEKVGKMVS